MSKNKIRVYYNSACPVCNAGVRHQKGKMQQCEVIWNDVHKNIDARFDLDSELNFIRERLHVIDKSGNINIGIDAFITLWKESSNDTWKAKLLAAPVMHGCAVVAYNIFAWLLYQWNKLLGHW